MKQCPKCGYENQNDSADCPRCGIIYEKFIAMHEEKEEREEDIEEVEEETEKEEEPHPDFEVGEKARFNFDFDEILWKVNDFYKQYSMHIIIGAVSFIVLLTILLILTSGIKGETGIVSWKNAIGEEGESALLFDYIGLLEEPELQDDENIDSVLCDMPNGSRVKVLKVKGEFLQIKVLDGKCSGITGYIPFENFEEL